MQEMQQKKYDAIIIGGGPAGLSAAIYARRGGLETLLLEKAQEGGTIAITAEVENYPGGIKGESGAELAARMAEQATSFGCDKARGEVVSVDFSGSVKEVRTADAVWQGAHVIIATGSLPQTLGVPGEAEFAGRGVSYCATCDAPFFRGLQVYVVGGGNSAVEEALHLAHFARQVTIIHRRDQLRASPAIQKKAMEAENIDFLWDTVVKEIKGEVVLGTIVAENVKSGAVTEITAPAGDGLMGLFVFAGIRPQTDAFEGLLDMRDGYIVTDECMRTNVPGVYAAGDVRCKELRQAVTAAADGAMAAYAIERDMMRG
ncbi:MAG: thioredoxin-disulfide reductase [Clostridiales Family XIII bacterium]|nr:thioredoxin-disulfide reductase [Clostridiales Family XIII bacterium]